LFNGIPPDLAERGDLASRTIRLEIPPLANRRTEADLEREFVAVWPEVLGALLDGVVAALANATSVDVTEIGAEPARLMDFEKWAEAGCRGMGFAEWEFVEAYAANRAGSMAAAAEGHPVARAVMALLKASPKGFRGQMSKLLEKLELYKGNVSWRDKWPRDAIRLGSELRRVRKPLAAVGITVLTGVDRRADGGSQKDVVVEWAEVA